MASERNRERIIDLLYDELTSEEESTLRGELANSAELRAEYDEMSALLSDVRVALPSVDVPSAVHQSILDMAKNAALEQEAKRQPMVAETPARGVWSRLTSGKGGQIALVATVLFAGAFVTRFVKMDDNRMAPMDEASVITEVSEVKFAPANAAAPAEIDKEALAIEQPAVEQTIVADGDTLDEVAEPEVVERERWNRGQVAKTDSERKASPRKKSAEGAKKLDSMLADNIFGSAEPKANQPSRDLGIVEKKSETSSATKSGKQRVVTSKNAPSKSPAVSADRADDKNKDRRPLEVAASEEESQQAYRPPRQSIGSVEQLYSTGDFSTTIQAADEFVALGSGSRTERARALQLKAQALSKTGRYQEALRVYDSITKNYPSFQSSAINSARAEVSRKLEEAPRSKKKTKKRAAKPKKSSYDFEADEIAPEANSTTD